MGVKPIKVVVLDIGSSDPHSAGTAATQGFRTRNLAIIAIFCVLVAAGAIWWHGYQPNSKAFEPTRYRRDTYAAFSNILVRAKALERRQATRTANLNLDLLHNYALIQRLADLSELYEEIDKGRQIIEDTRTEARAIFKNIYEIFPAECVNERLDSERLYDSLMASVDTIEQRLEDEEEALVLLDENREKWDVRGGRLVFIDKRLEREFKFFNRPTAATSIRWRRDFGHGTIESTPVVVLPEMKK